MRRDQTSLANGDSCCTAARRRGHALCASWVLENSSGEAMAAQRNTVWWRGIDRDEKDEGRLMARPSPPTLPHPKGLTTLGVAVERDALLYVPKGYSVDRPAPLAVMLHGAGGNGQHGMSLLRELADDTGAVLVAPASREDTWDVLLGGYGPDVAIIDAALDAASERCAIDPERVAIGGFSDGASYALSLGLTNGDVFTHVIAFSPGFMSPAEQVGRPRCYVSHGTRDTVLPIVRCSRRIVPMLERGGYDVLYHEFDGPHTIPPDIALEAVDWFWARND